MRIRILSLAVASLLPFAASNAVAQRASLATNQMAPDTTAVQRLSGFSIVLLVGDIQPGASDPNVPAAAAKALSDLKDFLPYKSYHLLDTEWTLGDDRAVSRLRGQGTDYELYVSASRAGAARGEGRGAATTAPSSTVAVNSFVLRDTGAGNPGTQNSPGLDSLRQQVDRQKELVARGISSKTDLQAAEQKLQEAEQKLQAAVMAANGAIIDTSFTMGLGETVVVGTSRLQGDKALIVLLTAVAR